MHEHQRSLMAVVDLLIRRICDAFSFDLLPPLSQVVVPQFVTVIGRDAPKLKTQLSGIMSPKPNQEHALTCPVAL